MYFLWNVSGLDKMLLVTCKRFLFLFVKKKKLMFPIYHSCVISGFGFFKVFCKTIVNI